MQLSAVGDLESRPISLLWPGRLALGKLAMLDGDPGLGKSLVTLDLCARLSKGRTLPDGAAGPRMVREIPNAKFIYIYRDFNDIAASWSKPTSLVNDELRNTSIE